jgi:hypothetical protein
MYAFSVPKKSAKIMAQPGLEDGTTDHCCVPVSSDWITTATGSKKKVIFLKVPSQTSLGTTNSVLNNH